MDYVTVDWDDDLGDKDLRNVLGKRLHELPDELRPNEVFFRHSSSGGRWHIQLLFRNDLTRDERFHVRESMVDDDRRLAWDRARVLGEGVVDYSRGVLYDVKGTQDFKTGDITMNEAGPWKRFPW